MVRGEVLSIRERDFVQAAVALGQPATGGSLVRHVLPNTFTPWLVVATLDMARVIVIESALSFLGLGVQPPTPTWGGMLADGRVYLSTAWWLATFPGPRHPRHRARASTSSATACATRSIRA